MLTTAAVSSDQTVTISSSYTSSGVTRTATLSVALQNVPDVTGSHAGRFTAFEGTKTCLTCHRDEAIQFHGSVHYQWSGDASDSEGLSTPNAGKMGGINDFCIYPDINWLGKLTTVDGAQVDGGCARCHTGLGLKPTASATEDQLENIDCLVCHSPSYKRTLATVNGSFRFVPDTAKMTVSILQAAVDLRKPGKDACLNCHTRAGGGDNFKRGDISEAHRNATTALDVHMAPSAPAGPASSAPAATRRPATAWLAAAWTCGSAIPRRCSNARTATRTCPTTIRGSTATPRASPATSATCRRSRRWRQPTCGATGACPAW